MSTELSITPDQTGFNDKQIAALRSLGVEDAPMADVALLFHQSSRTGLDPFARQIYLIGRNTKVNGSWIKKWSIQVGIDGFRLIRDRKGTYQGHVEEWCGPDGSWRDVWLEKSPPAAARVSVFVKGYIHPVIGIALWTEYVQTKNDAPVALWASKPALMLAKCAEALALRKAYPQDLSGLYTVDELPEAEQDADGVHVVTTMRGPDVGTPGMVNSRGHANETRVEAASSLHGTPGPVQASTPARTVDLSGTGRDNPPAKAPTTKSAASWIRDIQAAQSIQALGELHAMATRDNALGLKGRDGLSVDDWGRRRAEEINRAAAVEPDPTEGDYADIPDEVLY